MGKDRNKSQREKKISDEHYSNPDVCKYFLISFCPHDLFPNTKQDLGSCLKRHDEKFQKQFESDVNRSVFEIQYIKEYISTYCNSLIFHFKWWRTVDFLNQKYHSDFRIETI